MPEGCLLNSPCQGSLHLPAHHHPCLVQLILRTLTTNNQHQQQEQHEMVEAGGKIGEKGCLLNSPLLSLQPRPCSSPSMPCQNQYFHNLLSLILSRLNHHHQQREQKWMEGTMRTKRGSHVNIFFLAHPHSCLPCHKLSLVTLL